MPNIHVVARKNGVGIDRDVELMSAVIGDRGTIDWRHHRRPETIWSQLRARWSSTAPHHRSDLYLLAERIPRLFGPLPGKVALVPNQERFPRRHLARVLCKTRHAESIFQDFADVSYIGFTSDDRNLSAITPDYNRFFHLAGKSTLKGTETLVEVWSQHPQWPELTIVQAETNARPTGQKNIRWITKYLADDQLQKIQNEHGVHLCPSLSEGWGHYIVEAMSVGAVVLTTDGPPMNELVTAERGVVVPWYHSQPRHLGVNWHVDPAALEVAIQAILDQSSFQKAAIGQAAKTWYSENDHLFQIRFREVVEQLLQSKNYSETQAA